MLALGLAALWLAIPLLLAPWLAARLSRALGASVRVGHVGFAPLDAVLTLHAVSVQAPDASAPALVADRVRIDLQWLPLLRRAVLVRELAVESARLDVDRMAGDGSLLDAFHHADVASELPPRWTFALDRVVVRDTRLRLPDAGGEESLEMALREARISTMPRRATAFGRAPNLRVDAVVDGGRVRIDGSSDVTNEGLVVDARLRAQDVPLARLRPWVAGLGWSAVAGHVSGRLHYQRAPGRREVMTGRLLGRRLAVHVPALDEPALAIRKAVVDVDTVDLLARRIAIEAVTLHGATLAARADLAAPLPLLDGMDGPPDAAPAGRGRALRPERDGGATAWRWKAGRLTTRSARLRVLGRDGATVLRASIAGESLGPDAYWSPLRATVRGGDGVATFDGTARMTRGLALDGRLTAANVDVPAFARAFGMPWADLAQAGRGAADLSLALAAGAAEGPALGVQGSAAVTDLWLAGPDANEFALGAASVNLRVAGAVPRSGDDPKGSHALRISDATVGAPYVLLTRTCDGWLLPPLDGGAGDGIVVGSTSMRGGRLLIVDHAAAPAATLDFAVGDAWAGDVRLPGFTVGNFILAGRERRLGPLQLVGVRDAGGRRLELSGQSVPLAAGAGYLARAGLPYRFQGGTGAFRARVALGPAGWTADTTVTLRDPILDGDDAAIRASLGMPVEAALDTLRDPSGETTLHLLFASPRDGVGLSPDVVASAVRDAIVRAGQAPVPTAPFQINFAAGRTELTPQGARQVARIAELLGARRDLMLELAALPSTDDRRWLAARALADEPEETGGFVRILRALGVRGTRERIRQALEARVEGRAGRLDAGDEAALANLMAEREPFDADRLAALGAARVARVADALADHHAVARARVVVGDAGPDARSVPPAVRARIAVDSRAAWRSLPRAGARRRRRKRRPPGGRGRVPAGKGDGAC